LGGYFFLPAFRAALRAGFRAAFLTAFFFPAAFWSSRATIVQVARPRRLIDQAHHSRYVSSRRRCFYCAPKICAAFLTSRGATQQSALYRPSVHTASIAVTLIFALARPSTWPHQRRRGL
jgi:hypothetical protein